MANETNTTTLKEMLGTRNSKSLLTIYNNDNYSLPNFEAAVLNVRNNVSDAKILCIGENWTSGEGSSTYETIPSAMSYPARLAQLLTLGAYGLAVPISSLDGVNDTRWDLGASWNLTSYGMGGGGAFVNTTGAGTLTFTTDGPYLSDTYDIYYLRGVGFGAFNVSSTGGSITSVDSNGSSAVIKVTVTSPLSSYTNVVTVTATSPIVTIIGIDRRLSSKKRILVANAGIAGSTTNSWNTNPTDFGAIPAMVSYFPNLTIIALGVNDATASTGTPTVQTNIQNLINVAKATGDCILMSTPPSSTQPEILYETVYKSLFSSLAITNNIPFIDVHTYFGNTFNSNLMNDAINPNDLGYLTIANYINDEL